jgi:hypothetical protein
VRVRKCFPTSIIASIWDTRSRAGLPGFKSIVGSHGFESRSPSLSLSLGFYSTRIAPAACVVRLEVTLRARSPGSFCPHLMRNDVRTASQLSSCNSLFFTLVQGALNLTSSPWQASLRTTACDFRVEQNTSRNLCSQSHPLLTPTARSASTT